MTEVLARFDFVGEASRLTLVLLRAGGLVFFCPILGSEVLPARARGALALALALVLLPLLPELALPVAGALAWTAAALRELAVGFAFGIAGRAMFAAAEAAAELVAGQAGFGLASMIDPLTGNHIIATSVFHNLFTTALFLAADLHHVFLRGLVASYATLPPGTGLLEVGGLDRSAALLGTRVLAIAVQLAAPALVVTLTADLVLGLVGRALPQLQLLQVGYPFKMAAGIVALGVLTVTTGAGIRWIGRTLASDGTALVAALGGR